MKKTITSIIILILVILGGWYIVQKSKTTSTNTDEAVNKKNIVATVNKDNVTKEEFGVVQSDLLNSQGLKPSSTNDEIKNQIKDQALNILINQKLLQQAVSESGVTVNQDDITTQLSSVKSRFEDDATYQGALAEQNITEKQLIEQIKNELITQRFFTQELDLESLTATEEEIQANYEQSMAGQENVPELEEIKGEIESFVIQQKQRNLINEYIQGLRDVAEIEILI